MTKGRQLWPGDEMRAFFEAHAVRDASIDAETARRLADRLTQSINRMLVWDMPTPVAESSRDSNAVAPAHDRSTGADAATRPAVPLAPSSPLSPSPSTPKNKIEKSGRPAAKPFDPYMFSAMVVLAKTGADGLLKRLAEIKTADHLRQFADAQHLGLEQTLVKPDELRGAIVRATEQRLADRKAAAS